MRIITTVIKAALVAYLVIFAVINIQNVSLKLFFNAQPISMPMFLFAIIAVFLGFLAGVLMMTGEKLSADSRARKLRKELEQIKNENARLKNIAVTENAAPAPAAGKALPEPGKETAGERGSDAGETVRNALR